MKDERETTKPSIEEAAEDFHDKHCTVIARGSRQERINFMILFAQHWQEQQKPTLQLPTKRGVNRLFEDLSRIERQVKMIQDGKVKVKTTGEERLNTIRKIAEDLRALFKDSIVEPTSQLPTAYLLVPNHKDYKGEGVIVRELRDSEMEEYEKQFHITPLYSKTVEPTPKEELQPQVGDLIYLLNEYKSFHENIIAGADKNDEALSSDREMIKRINAGLTYLSSENKVREQHKAKVDSLISKWESLCKKHGGTIKDYIESHEDSDLSIFIKENDLLIKALKESL